LQGIVHKKYEQEMKNMTIRSGIRNYEEKFEAIRHFIERLDRNPKKFPEKAIVFTLDDRELSSLFTKERLRLINKIKNKKPKSMRKLAEMVDREESAVNRDVKILEDFGIVKLIKKGKIVKPFIEQALMVVTITRIETIGEELEEGKKLAVYTEK
jgi:predicted transcriptional regulator